MRSAVHRTATVRERPRNALFLAVTALDGALEARDELGAQADARRHTRFGADGRHRALNKVVDADTEEIRLRRLACAKVRHAAHGVELRLCQKYQRVDSTNNNEVHEMRTASVLRVTLLLSIAVLPLQTPVTANQPRVR